MSSSTSSGRASPPDLVVAPEQPASARARPYLIAHRAGNNLHQLEDALEKRVDAIECDFWHAQGRLALRHERRIGPLPVIYDKWYMRWAWGELRLRDVLLEVNRRCDLFLDIKSSTPRAAEAVLELYQDERAMLPRTLVSSKQWKLLDRLMRANTSMRMYYSVGNERQLRALLRRPGRGRVTHGTSIRHTLLTPETIAGLHAAGIEVFAWTVNTEDRAEELASWGVDGIISDDLSVLEALQGDASDEVVPSQ